MAVSGVTISDVSTSLGRSLSDAEQLQTSQWVEDAELIIKARLGDLVLLDGPTLSFVVREAVVARLRNPDGVQYEAIDDYRYGMPTESRRVTILDEWWRMLDPDTGSSAFSARPYFTADTPDLTTGWA